jgi:hypothetical protein
MLQTKRVDSTRSVILEMEDHVYKAARLANACVVFAKYGTSHPDGMDKEDSHSLEEIAYSLRRAALEIEALWLKLDKLTEVKAVAS